MNKQLPPFSCTYSPQIPELLQNLGISIAISTYQVGKVILLSPKNRDELIQLPRNFSKPMGIAIDENKMAIAGFDDVTILSNSVHLSKEYPKQPGTYDSFYVPRCTYYSGQSDLHDLAWGKEGLWAVNTRFSCLSIINDKYSFEPRWKPSFITDLSPEDRCHLNGLALFEDKPKYVTALGQTNTPQGWRDNKAKGGILMDVQSQKIILDELPMPHSPRVYNNELYTLLSGTGELIKVHPDTGKYDI